MHRTRRELILTCPSCVELEFEALDALGELPSARGRGLGITVEIASGDAGRLQLGDPARELRRAGSLATGGLRGSDVGFVVPGTCLGLGLELAHARREGLGGGEGVVQARVGHGELGLRILQVGLQLPAVGRLGHRDRALHSGMSHLHHRRARRGLYVREGGTDRRSRNAAEPWLPIPSTPWSGST